MFQRSAGRFDILRSYDGFGLDMVQTCAIDWVILLTLCESVQVRWLVPTWAQPVQILHLEEKPVNGEKVPWLLCVEYICQRFFQRNVSVRKWLGIHNDALDWSWGGISPSENDFGIHNLRWIGVDTSERIIFVRFRFNVSFGVIPLRRKFVKEENFRCCCFHSWIIRDINFSCGWIPPKLHYSSQPWQRPNPPPSKKRRSVS